MVFQAPSRFILASLWSVLLVPLFACGRSGTQNEVTRHGEDIIASGSASLVTDTVQGDAILAGGDLRFVGATSGDYLGAGGNQAIGGKVHGSIRAVGGEIHVTAVADRNATLAGGDVALDREAVIGRNAYLAGGTVQVDGTVREALRVAGGTVILNGVVGRDVQVVAGALRIGPRAEIAGDVRYRVPASEVQIDPAAHISGKLIALPIPERRGNWHFLGILWMLGFLVAGAVLVALVPRFVTEAAEIFRMRPGRSALVGLGWLILVPITICLAAVTIIGLPLALLAAAVYSISICVGRVPVAVWLGRRVLGARARTGRQGALLNFLVGGLILLLVRIVPVLGPLTMVIATVLGLGAFVLRAQALRETQSM